MLSVAVCTYNGAQFIREQLESILRQTRLVDEIVICDDGSTDDTLKIIEEIRVQTTVRIRVYCNEQRLGVYTNFQKAINLCEGDIIFLSDQDDVWHPNKVRVIVKYFSEHPNHKVVFTDGQLIDETGCFVPHTSLWKCFGLTNQCLKCMDDGYAVELLAFGNRATGATMAIKRDFKWLHNFSNYCSDNLLHDGVLAMLAINNNQLGYISKSLINYRIHTKQNCGIGDRLTNPMSSDPREVSYVATFWNKLTLPSPINKRIIFAEERGFYQHKPLGLLWMFKSSILYLKFYHHMWLSFLLYDSKQWCQTVWQYLISNK